MRAARVFTLFVVVFAAALVASAIVTFLWGLTVHGESAIDWEASVRLALVLGIVCSVVEAWEHMTR
jgi:hypothetical protein